MGGYISKDERRGKLYKDRLQKREGERERQKINVDDDNKLMFQ